MKDRPMEALKRTSLSEAVTQRLLSLISERGFEPGGKIPPEPRLCEMLGVSRTALREGIKVLVGINVLTVLQGRGTFVNESQNVMVGAQALGIALDRETVRNIYQVRSVLDAGIARYAAMQANASDIKACRRAVRKTELSLESEPWDIKAAAEGDEEFHLALCEATHNSLLVSISWPIINHAVLKNWKLACASTEVARHCVAGHKEILRAIEQRDVDAALGAVEQHLKESFENFYK